MKYNPASINPNGKWNQGHFIPKNPQKYIGDVSKLVYRSGWERDFYNTCDLNPAILQWGSETISIPYTCPVSGKIKQYFPDIFLTYMDKSGTMISECIEIKPQKQSLVEHAKSKRDKLALLINQAKWQAANTFCNNNGLKFRVLTEASLYKKG